MNRGYIFFTFILLLSPIIILPVDIASKQNAIFQEYLSYDATTYMVEMRDGVCLATDVYFPSFYDEEKSYPVILTRTPYGKDAFSNLNPSGIIYIVQDVRGRYASEGIDTVFMNDSTDGFDTIEWILKQSWCNGKIVTEGGSALGINQYLLTLSEPPALKAQCIIIGTPDPFSQALFWGGAFRYSLIVQWLTAIGSTHFLPTIYTHESYSDFWENYSLTGKYDRVHAPAIHLGGWFDCFQQGTLDGFQGYQYNSSLEAQGKSFLIIGPWCHGTWNTKEQGEVIFPANSLQFTYNTLYNDFISKYLFNESISLAAHPTVNYYCMGPSIEGKYGNFWRTSDVWPIPVNYTNWYFHENGLLSPNIPITSELADSYFYDPNNPVPTIGGGNLAIPSGPYDQSALENRDDVLTYTSEEFTHYLEITGQLKAKLWISSDRLDTDFTVKITDVYPDGTSMLIQDGIVRAKYRNSTSSPELLVPNEIVPVEINLWSTSYIFNEGHRIRIAISSSNYPRFNANPNNGAPLFSNNETLIANNTIYHDNLHPSHIILPINQAGPVVQQTDETTEKSGISIVQSISIALLSISLITLVTMVTDCNRKEKKNR
ncbi:MAG: CocE/NonD family hydrolase [Candidatus Thorarchaeota archaeon]